MKKNRDDGAMKSYLLIYPNEIGFEPTDKVEDLLYLTAKENQLLEVGLNIKISPDVKEKEKTISEYIQTKLLIHEKAFPEFLSFLAEEYKTVAMFMKLSEGRHPIDCLANLFLKYCRTYQKKTMNVYDYVQAITRKIGLEDNLLIEDYVWETDIEYTSDFTQAHFECEAMWLTEDGVEISNHEVSLSLDEEQMKKAFITFLNPCLIS